MDSRRQSVREELQRELARLSYAGAIVYPTLFLFACLTDNIHFDNFAKLTFGVVLLLSLCRFTSAALLLRSRTPGETILKLLRASTLGQIVIWSLFSCVTIQQQEDYRAWAAVVLLIIAAGLAPAGAFSLASDQFLAKSFLFTLWVSHAPLLLGGLRDFAMVTTGTVYTLYWMVQSKRQFERLSHSILAQESLRVQADDLQKANEEARLAREFAEKALAQAQDASRAKSQFMATMSHEIRTPLHGVLGMNTILLDTDLDEEQLDCAETIRESGKALLSIINEVLDFSKLEAGHQRQTIEEFHLLDFLKQTLGILRQKAQEKDLETRIIVDGNLPQWIRGDLGHLRQVLLNLLGNAIKFTDEGSVCLEARKLQTSPEVIWVEFAISDTGIGVPIEKQSLLFEPFQQVNSSSTRTRGGTGLGLAISRGLAELMGGTLQFEGGQEGGSIFKLRLPLGLLEVSPVANRSKFAERIRLDGKRSEQRILVAEDNLTNQKILTRLLSRAGFQFDVVSNGREAYEAVQGAEDYSLILMDCHMPEMDGYEASLAILDALGEKAPPIVAVTATNSSEEQRLCEDSGMSGFLSKPVRLQELQNVLDEYIQDF